MTAVLTIVTAYVGIDVAKTKLDVVLRLGEEEETSPRPA